MSDQATPLTGRDVRGDLVCTQCARVAGSVQGANVRLAKSVALHLNDPLQADTVRRLRCPHCSGRLWLQNSEEVPVDPLLFNREALRPYRGRPPKMPRMP
jgi:DNA-directed RNA polymerase subunit RPC12/RpoP